jgi:hypothetical protein
MWRVMGTFVDCLWTCEVVPLWQNITKRSVRSHRVYKPSPNEWLFPRALSLSLYYNLYVVVVFISLHIYCNISAVLHISLSTVKRLVATHCNRFFNGF